MATSNDVAPVIIKRKKVVSGGGHHGGAWKVAYADFVTAMMAFFMLMWLLNATTEKQRKGLADYFSPSVPLSRVSGGGDGAFGGDSVFSEQTLPQNGTGGERQSPGNARQSRGATGVDSSDAEKQHVDPLEELQEMLMARSGDSLASPELQRHILARVTDQGLVIEISAREGAPLFRGVGREATPTMRRIVSMIARVAGRVTNGVAIEGHVRANPVVIKDNPVWQVSADRATQVRELLERGGLAATRVKRVTGHADRTQARPDPMSVENNRIKIILLRE